MPRFATLIALVCFLLAPACPGTAQEVKPTVRVYVSPKVQLLPMGGHGTVLIRVSIPWTPQNRSGCVTVDGPMFRSSCWESLQGGAQTQEFRYSGLSAGEYAVIGEVQWVEGATGERKVSTARDTFVITSGGGEGF